VAKRHPAVRHRRVDQAEGGGGEQQRRELQQHPPDADDVDVLATDNIENDVTTFRETPVPRVNVVSFASCDKVLCF